MPASGIASSVTTAFWLYVSLQSGTFPYRALPQLIPATDEAIVPVPVPFFVVVRVYVGTVVNVAVTALSPVICKLQGRVPVHAPLHPLKTDHRGGIEVVSVIQVFCIYCSEQSVPQLIPSGDEKMLPFPVPTLLVVRVCFGKSVNVAITFLFHVTETIQTPVPLQSPLHPLNIELAVGTAVSVTLAPLGYS